MRRTPWTVAGPPKSSTFRTAPGWNAGDMTKGADEHDESKGGRQDPGAVLEDLLDRDQTTTNSQRTTGLLEISRQIPAHSAMRKTSA